MVEKVHKGILEAQAPKVFWAEVSHLATKEGFVSVESLSDYFDATGVPDLYFSSPPDGKVDVFDYKARHPIGESSPQRFFQSARWFSEQGYLAKKVIDVPQVGWENLKRYALANGGTWVKGGIEVALSSGACGREGIACISDGEETIVLLASGKNSTPSPDDSQFEEWLKKNDKYGGSTSVPKNALKQCYRDPDLAIMMDGEPYYKYDDVLECAVSKLLSSCFLSALRSRNLEEMPLDGMAPFEVLKDVIGCTRGVVKNVIPA